jgi:hypothetical protein
MSKPEIISGKSGFITQYPMYPYTHHNFVRPFVNPRIRQFPKQTRPLQLPAVDAHRVNKAIKQPLLPMRQAASRRGRRLTSRLPSMIYSRGVGVGEAAHGDGLRLTPRRGESEPRVQRELDTAITQLSSSPAWLPRPSAPHPPRPPNVGHQGRLAIAMYVYLNP